MITRPVCYRCHAALLVALSLSLGLLPQTVAAESPPNIVVIFTDDQGYGDVGVYGAEDFDTPHLDQLAAEGMRFTDFYVAQPVCSASRAALLSGCYPNRIGILGALGPASRNGIHADELLLPEVAKQRGYATAIFGKWHLGHKEPCLPLQHGFDEYFGLPYSNDMWPRHPERPNGFPPLPLIEGNRTVEENPDQSQLTTWYTQRAVDFIDRHHDQPFLLYVPQSMPHVPLFVSDKFAGSSPAGLYGDVIQEIDWSVGQISEALERHGLTERTLVLFFSDNGPWLNYGDHAGSAAHLREGKGTTFDGGVRVPALARWPGKIPAGTVCAEPCMTIDVLPTVAALLEVELPEQRIIDGRNIWPLLAGEPDAKSPHEALYFYWGNELQAVRSGKWKLHLPHNYRTLAGRPGGTGGTPTRYEQADVGQALFDLQADPGETTDLAAEHPEVVKRLLELVEVARADLGDSAVGRQGANLRPAGKQ